MKKNNLRKMSIVVGLSTLALSTLACNLISLGSMSYREPVPQEPYFEEARFEEPKFEEPFFEEPQFEEQHHEEPFHPEEPAPAEPMPQEPQQPASQQPQPQPKQPQPQPQQPAKNEPWATDFAITDIYPGKMPHGQFWFRLTNHGPKNASNVNVPVVCVAESTNYFNGSKASASTGRMVVKAKIGPGQTQAFATGLKLDTKNFWYQVTCEIQTTDLDINPGNNGYSETVPPPP